MQVGSFYEVYSAKDTDPDMMYFSKLCDLKIAQKNEYFMAGFRDYMIDKYIQKLNETSYTTVIFNQEEKDGIIERKEFAIYSPGTTFIEDEIKLSNNISCIWIHQIKQKQIIFGVSNIDIYTGKTNVFEYEHVYYHNPSTYDNIENFVSIYNPIEIILIYSDEETIDSIIHYIGIKSKKIVKICLNQDTALSKQAISCESQHYQNEIIKTFYSMSKTSFVDALFEKGIAFQSFCFLLNYVFEHNPSLTNKISEPFIDNQNNNLLLANHSLKQLNVLESDYIGPYSSVIKLLNTCRTSVGKRYMNHILLNPIKQVDLLEESYSLTEHALSKGFACCLQIKDIEKIIRKIIHKKACPSDYYYLYECGEILMNIFSNLDTTIKIHIEEEKTLSDIKIIKKHLTTFFNMDICKQMNSTNFDKYEDCVYLINKDVNSELDIALQTKIENKEKLDAIITHLNAVYTFIDKKCRDAVKVHDTNSGSFLTITKKRCDALKKKIISREITFISSYTKKEEKFLFSGDLIYSEYNSTTTMIQSEQINHLFKTAYSSNDIYMKLLIETYNKMYETASCFSFDKIVDCIRKLDLLNTKCELATMYKYCRPQIHNEKDNKSYAKMKGLRHVLIEHIEKNELYVTNDIELGLDNQGILLFGTNAVGKTSLIKSIGVCIIMAQAGLYVPCDSMIYYPYEYLFTRIIGNDNIFKGLSTFGVEMSELRVILNKCNKNSLILGDELCSGTEIDSALSIFTAGLETMYARGSSFIFATHFHQIQYFEEIQKMTKLSLKHLRVKYNHELQKLVYDRKLADGAGESIYGLEVCKSLHLPDDFLKRAHEIRGKFIGSQSILTLKTSAHNREKVRGVCELCKKNIGTEIHHLQYQRDADKNGIIKHFHKNHLANLVSICESCHTNIHDSGSVFEKRKTLDGETILGLI
uniref:DNA mismatch repair proteins mutS family domain-containing protein n=1 Tax=viral metagenome TaxID=1070528 RepID=A0A6C0D1E1_9ZZZZ